MSEPHPVIAHLQAEARRREDEEAEFRRTMKEKVAALAQARAFANRRMNVVRSLFDTVRQAPDEDIAAAAAITALRNRLGWRDDSDARMEVLGEYAKVAVAAFASVHPSQERADVQRVSLAGSPAPDAAAALAAFEDWYEEARGKPFWVLFEHYMPETQLVDF